MKIKNLIYVSAILAIGVACKKDEEETSISPSLDGVLQIVGLDEYVSPGQKVTLSAKGLKHPDGGEIGYYWKVVPSKPQSDTVDVFEFTFTDTLQTCTIYCTAYASGYSGSSVIAYSTVVDGRKDGSLQGLDALVTPLTGTDYYQTTIGSQTWIQNNLHETSHGAPYRNYEVMSNILGRFYNYEDAVAACESLDGGNWKLPSKEDWEVLEAYTKNQISETYGKSLAAALCADATFNSDKMWEYWPSVGKLINGTGFSAIPAGYSVFPVTGSVTDYTGGTFLNSKSYAAFWTSTEAVDPTKAYYKYLYVDQPEVFTGIGDKLSFGASVRCIKK